MPIKKNKPLEINFATRHAHSRLQELRYIFGQRNVLDYLISRFKWNQYPKRFHVSNFPGHVDVELSSVCQIRCPMCFLTLRDDVPKNLMPVERFKRVMTEIAKKKPHSIRLSWRGECLLHPDFKEMVAHARSVYKGSISFLTNGLKLEPDLMDFIIDQEIDYIVISADGVGATYEEVRKPGIYSELVERLQTLKEKKRQRGTNRPFVRLNGVALWFTAEEEAEFNSTFSPLADRIQMGDILSNFDSDDVPVERDPEAICPSPWQRVMIGWNGNVFPCCDDFSELYPLGNVDEQSIEEIWHGKPMEQLREWQRGRERLKCELCRERDCGIDRSTVTKTKTLLGRLREQVVKQYGPDTPLLKYVTVAEEKETGEKQAGDATR